MSEAGEHADDAFEDALIAARLASIDPGLGGMVLRGGGDLRAGVIDALRAGLAAAAPMRRMPVHIEDDRLLGGLDLGATLASGRSTSRPGLLAEADRGVLVIPMAERLPDTLVGRLSAVLDSGEVCTERDGATLRTDARFVVVALDDGAEAEECAPAALAERLAFWLDLSTCGRPLPSLSQTDPSNAHRGDVEPAGDEGNAIAIRSAPPEVLEGFAAASAALGIGSIRAPLFALRAARASARLAGRDAIAKEDIALGARLVLGPRATRVPVDTDEPEFDTTPPQLDTEEPSEEGAEQKPIEDLILAAALAALPKDVLAGLADGRSRQPARSTGSGERRSSPTRGRKLGARPGTPSTGVRLSLIDTLRAAAPWQKLREGGAAIKVRREDLRIRRFETRAEGLTIFSVDASGSAALARLAEAKGAIELLLGEAYIKRTQVALVAFRGVSAELLLPPTRSLTRARRLLAELPGGGGTPLAAGLTAAHALAERALSRGRTPYLVVLTDGRANIAADGSVGRATAAVDAIAAAKAIGAARIGAAFVDISARPGPEGATLAAAMRARYLPLPRADAAAMHAAINAARRG